MLLSAILACGARHLALIDSRYSEDDALHHHVQATKYLLNSLKSPTRDSTTCAITSVVLNAYDIVHEHSLQRMNRLAGARALIKECGWNAKSTGVGAACFWVNITMELLSCIQFNWQIAWDPDDWGVDMNFTRDAEHGKEDVWAYRIVYVLAKICNFRASMSKSQEGLPSGKLLSMGSPYRQWLKLLSYCDAWDINSPRAMHPMAYSNSGHEYSPSAFPEVWLVNRVAIAARLFYHTSMVLLAQTNPVMSVDHSVEMQNLRNNHSQQIFSIAAHVKHRVVANIALRSLTIAAECLTDPREQEEVLQILARIVRGNGWNVEFICKDLQKIWGWNDNKHT